MVKLTVRLIDALHLFDAVSPRLTLLQISRGLDRPHPPDTTNSQRIEP